MRRISLVCGLSVLLVIAAGAMKPAQAAVPGPPLPIVGLPSSIAAGVFIPSDNESKHAGGSTQFDVDFRYGLPLSNLVTPLRTVIGLGVETGASHGSHSTIIPLTATEIVSTTGGSPFAAGAFYVGGGLGVYFMNQSGLSSAARIGGQVEAGYNFTSAVFLDAKYQIVNHANGVIGTVGLRF